jgi:hypothetical protein
MPGKMMNALKARKAQGATRMVQHHANQASINHTSLHMFLIVKYWQFRKKLRGDEFFNQRAS